MSDISSMTETLAVHDLYTCQRLGSESYMSISLSIILRYTRLDIQDERRGNKKEREKIAI